MQQIQKNPILSGFYPDPSICRAGNDYYLVTSTFCYFPGIPVFHSTDLVHWNQIGNVLDRESQIPLAGTGLVGIGIYAPTIRYHEGVFYVITTNVRGGIGNFIVTATDPAGPWSDPIPLHSEGIDPSLFFDDDGKCYYCGTKARREGSRYFGDNEIYIQELDLNTMTLVGESWPAWHGALRNVEWPEGPHIYKKDGWYYLLISEAGTAHMHCVTVARSKNLNEPFTGYAGNPILTHRHLGLNYPIVNVGHPDIVETQNGEWWMVALASRPYGGGYHRNLGRETFLVPMTWENGWPLINPGKGIIEDTFTAPNLPECEKIPVPDYDDFDYDTLPLHYMYLRNPDMNKYSLSERKGFIRLYCSPEDICSNISPTLICRRQTDMSYELETLIEYTPNEGEQAGLVLLQSDTNYYSFYVSKRDGKDILAITKSYMNNGDVVKEEVASTELTKGFKEGITLHIKQDIQNLSFSYKIGDSEYIELASGADARILCTDAAGGFVGTCLGIYASSEGKESDNYADFDYLMYNC